MPDEPTTTRPGVVRHLCRMPQRRFYNGRNKQDMQDAQDKTLLILPILKCWFCDRAGATAAV
jgi:3-polyprenyl-4-hydroxybenzoate decarboxylase